MATVLEPQPASGTYKWRQGGLTSKNAPVADPKAHVATTLRSIKFSPYVFAVVLKELREITPRQLTTRNKTRGTSKGEGRGGPVRRAKRRNKNVCVFKVCFVVERLFGTQGSADLEP